MSAVLQFESDPSVGEMDDEEVRGLDRPVMRYPIRRSEEPAIRFAQQVREARNDVLVSFATLAPRSLGGMCATADPSFVILYTLDWLKHEPTPRAR